jgi:hypothetical protein
VDGVAEACGGSNRSNVEALGFALRSLGRRRHGKGARYRLLGLGLLALLGDGAGKRSGAGLGGSRGESVDRLVNNVIWLENIVYYAVAVILLARAVVDDPIAIDDKLSDVLASFARQPKLGGSSD